MFDLDSSSVVIGIFIFRSNLVSKVYQYRSCKAALLEVAILAGSLRKNSKIHCCWGVSNLLMEQAQREHPSMEDY